jgi:hypothetical protein
MKFSEVKSLLDRNPMAISCQELNRETRDPQNFVKKESKSHSLSDQDQGFWIVNALNEEHVKDKV